MAVAEASGSAKARILVLQTPDSPELETLERLPPGATIVGVGRTLEELQKGRRCPAHLMPTALSFGHASANMHTGRC